jgi:S1-C subfamily serine protease
MSETRLRYLLAALTLSLSLLAWSVSARAEGAEALPGVAGIDTEGSWQPELGFDWKRDRALLIAELISSDVMVAPAEAGPDDVPRFLTGKLQELRCARNARHANCRMSVHWEIVDSVSGVTVYDTVTRVTRYAVEHKTLNAIREGLLRESITSLATRKRFVAAMRHRPESAPALAPATFKPCSAPPLRMPSQAPDAIAASVLLDMGSGIGSGFFLNDEGLVLTAAHVTTQADFKVRLPNGKVYAAGIVRFNRDADVALVRVQGLTGTPCLRLAEQEPSMGADLYAIGAPGDPNLSFSLTRGIVSSLRTVKGFRRVQTDTPISPGNSGGPLLGADGRVEAIVQSKVVRRGVEGVAFGLPSKLALAALGLSAGPKTQATLDDVLQALPSFQIARDPSDVVGPLEDDEPAPVVARPARVIAQQPYEASNAELLPPPARDAGPGLPGYVHGLRWGGLGLAVVGVTMAGVTSEKYSKTSSTMAEYESLRTWNDVGWVALIGGATAFGISFAVAPKAPTTSVSAGCTPQRCGIVVGGSL